MIPIPATSPASCRSRVETGKNGLGTEGVGDIVSCGTASDRIRTEFVGIDERTS